MKLVIEGRAGRRICDWESFALLRDNAQHYIEGGAPSGRFAAMHEIERAVDEGERIVDASRLRGEVLRAWSALWKVPLKEAAISLRTRAIMTGSAEPPACRGTVPAEQVGWPLPVPGPTTCPVPRAAQSFIRAILSLTPAVVDGEQLRITCLMRRQATRHQARELRVRS